MLLPENKPMEKDITPKIFFIWGQSMHGKTYLARQFPNPIIINTDGNGKKIDTPHVDVEDFETFVEVLKEIESGKHTYQTIVIDLVDDIKTFVKNAEKYDCDIIVRNRDRVFQVDGTSLIGLFSLNLSEPVEVEINDNKKAEAFKQDIHRMIV